MKNLDAYIKKPKGEKIDCKQTSVNIDSKHYKFIVDMDLNLSEMVRDMLDTFMGAKQGTIRRRSTD